DLWSNGFARSLHTQFIPSGARDLWSNGSARSLHRRFAALSINSQNVNSTGPDPLRIQTMFASIASRYDRANTILSAGVHHRWRKAAVRITDPKPGDRILDCATGTGDLAIAFHKAVGERGVVVGTDFTPEMIELARAKSPSIR